MYYKDNKEYTAQEIDNLYPNIANASNFAKDFGFEVVFKVPTPTVTNLQTYRRDGTEVDSKGNRVEKYIVVDKFSDIEVDGVVITKAEQEAKFLEDEFKATAPTVITMRQARLALLGANLLTTVDDAIATGTDEALKIEWEYATECRRDWQSLIVMATALGVTELQLDEMFILGSTL